MIALFQMCAATPPQSSSLPSAEFWFDDSVSMQGYVNVPSAYKTIVNRVLQGAIQSGYTSTMRGFSAANAAPLDSLVPLLNGGFYRATDTPLASVIDTIAAPPTPGAHAGRKIVVLVSDLIQAEGSRDALSVSAALRRAALRYPYVALYGFRSAFRGIYYVETLPKHRVQVDTLDGTGRPFYLLIMAESPDELRQFQQLAHLFEISSDRDFDPHVFEPSVPPVVVKSAGLRTDSSAKQWDPFLTHLEWKCGDRLSQIQSYRSKKGVVPGKVELEIDLQASEQLPVVVPSRYKAEIRQLDSTFSKVVNAPTAIVTASGPAAQASCRLRYELPPLSNRKWDVYSIRMRAGDANLSPPEWL
ncbi:MAG: hypothetical protein ACRD3J_12785, partial [Thermoanaerobaculia bacterium]